MHGWESNLRPVDHKSDALTANDGGDYGNGDSVYEAGVDDCNEWRLPSAYLPLALWHCCFGAGMEILPVIIIIYLLLLCVGFCSVPLVI